MNYAITHDITNEVEIKHKKHIRILIISACVFLIYLIEELKHALYPHFPKLQFSYSQYIS